MTSADFSFLTLRNIRAYESTGATVEDNYVLTISSFGKQKWTNDLNLNTILTNAISSNIMTASEMSANEMVSNTLNATTLTANAMTTNTINFNNNINIIGKYSTIISTVRKEDDLEGDALPAGIPSRYKLLLYDPLTHEMVYYDP